MQKQELDALIVRWKRSTRMLPDEMQPVGKFLTDILEKQKYSEIVRFTDPVEAAAFFCLRELVTRKTGNTSRSRDLEHGPIREE